MTRPDDDLRPVFHLALPLPILTLPMLLLGSVWGLRRERRGPWSWAVAGLFVADAILLWLWLTTHLPQSPFGEGTGLPERGWRVEMLLGVGPFLAVLALVLALGARREHGWRGAAWVALPATVPLFLDALALPLHALGLPLMTAMALAVLLRCVVMGALALHVLTRLGIAVAEPGRGTVGRTFLLGLAYVYTLGPRAAVIAYLACAHAGLDLSQWVTNPVQEVTRTELPWATGLALIVIVVLIAPLVEELLMRGLVLGWLRRWSRDGTAVAVSALLFALMHPLYGPLMVVPFVYGVVLAWARLRSGGLVAPIAMHMFINGAVVLLQSIAQAAGGGP